MSISFLVLALATLTGVTAYHLLETVYYKIMHLVHKRQYQAWQEESESWVDDLETS